MNALSQWVEPKSSVSNCDQSGNLEMGTAPLLLPGGWVHPSVGCGVVSGRSLDLGGAGGISDPCQSSNKCTNPPAKGFAAGHKTAALTRLACAELERKYGPEQIVLVTLTFRYHVTNAKTAQKAWSSFRTHIMKRYGAWIRVFERQESGRIHYHLVLAVDAQMNSLVDLAAVQRFLEEKGKKYRFGITLVEWPRCAGAAANYLTKGMEVRDPRNRGVRLVAFSHSAWVGNVHFSWNNDNGRQWRSNVAAFASHLGCTEYADLSKLLGVRWAYNYRDVILSLTGADSITAARTIGMLVKARRRTRDDTAT